VTKYLITGGAGFIGSNFVRTLMDRGDHVTILDNFSRPGARINIDWLMSIFRHINVINADIRTDKQQLKKVIDASDVIYHLASQVAVTTSIRNPVDDFETNVIGTINILEAIRASRGDQILIYASTNKVYGDMEHLVISDEPSTGYRYRDLPAGINEDAPLDFHSPYGCSKGAADQYVRDYSRTFGLRTVVMRQSCIYGPRQFGIEDQGWVAWFIIAAVLERPLVIYGDGKQTRDLLHVDDLFKVYDAAERKISISKGEIYNVGGGQANILSLLGLIAQLERLLGRKVQFTFSTTRPGDQKTFVADTRKCAEHLNWSPTITIDEGLTNLYDWVVKHKSYFS
jgi:CDP-paratose 2-epimerase